jgi:phosphatidylserine decarboxylase
MEDFEDRRWQSFNDFFIRRFRPGARQMVAEPHRMPAFAEARYLAFPEITPAIEFPVKGTHLTPAAVLGDPALAAQFSGGPLLLARLAPVDYHRFHFPDSGRVIEERHIPGRLHSVNPIALARRNDTLASNERHVTLISSTNFGRLAMVEVGAMNVGRIVQTHAGAAVERGQEKGYFCFGGSSVLLFGEAGRWCPSADLLEQTALERETLLRLGEEVAVAPQASNPRRSSS